MAKHSPAELAAGAVVLIVAFGFLAYAVARTGRGDSGGDLLHASFDRIDGLTLGSDVRIAGVKVGSVVASRLNPQTFRATVDFTVESDVRLPTDSSAEVISDGLLGGKYLSLTPGGDTATIPDGGTVTITQSSINIEELLGRFIFSAANLADSQHAAAPSAPAKPAAPAGGLPPLGGSK